MVTLRRSAFWDSFNSAIHTNDLLEGAAYDAIPGVGVSSANYGEAVEILKKSFGNNHFQTHGVLAERQWRHIRQSRAIS